MLAIPLSRCLGAQKPSARKKVTYPHYILIKPTPAYLKQLKAARASAKDYFWEKLKAEHKPPTYNNVKNFLAPIAYVNAPWKYIGVILSPEGSSQKMRVIENGSEIDAGLTRRTPIHADAWAYAKTFIRVYAGPQNQIFGLNEHRQGLPHYEDGYLPVLRVSYRVGGTTYKETVLARRLIASYRSPYLDTPGVAAYIKVTAENAPGEIAFRVTAPKVDYGFPIVPLGFRHDKWTDGLNNVIAWFSKGAKYDAKTHLVHYKLDKGQSAYVVFPFRKQPAGTVAAADAHSFNVANADVASTWKKQLATGGQVSVPQKVVMNAYRSLFIGDLQLTIGDELPYGMFSYYEGNGFAEALEAIAPFIEYGYFKDARRFIQPILDYPMSDKNIGLDVCAVRLELASYYYQMSGDAEFIRKNEKRLEQVANFFLAHRQKSTGLVLDGYGYDVSGRRVLNLNTNSNGWRAIQDLANTLIAVDDKQVGEKYLAISLKFGQEVREAVLKNIDHSTHPPFVPFALGQEKPYQSLIESKISSYYNIVMPYFFESEIFPPRSAPYMDILHYMWDKHGVMAGLQRFDQHSTLPDQDGIHPLYTWGREFEQIAAHDPRRAIYTFYSALADGYTRGTFLTGECQGTVPSADQWKRGTYLPPEPPANALLLRSLRHMLIQESDRDKDGVYHDLWLLSSAPRVWLANGKQIRFEGMPTRFGPVSLSLESHLSAGSLAGLVRLAPGIRGKHVMLFVRLPHGYKVRSAALADGKTLRIGKVGDDPVVFLPARAGAFHFVVQTVAQSDSH